MRPWDAFRPAARVSGASRDATPWRAQRACPRRERSEHFRPPPPPPPPPTTQWRSLRRPFNCRDHVALCPQMLITQGLFLHCRAFPLLLRSSEGSFVAAAVQVPPES